jgi:hypothetical protein
VKPAVRTYTKGRQMEPSKAKAPHSAPGAATHDAHDRRMAVVPDRDAVLRLVGAVLAEQNDEWADASRRYVSLEAIARTLSPQDPEASMEVAMIAA